MHRAHGAFRDEGAGITGRRLKVVQRPPSEGAGVAVDVEEAGRLVRGERHREGVERLRQPLARSP